MDDDQRILLGCAAGRFQLFRVTIDQDGKKMKFVFNLRYHCCFCLSLTIENIFNKNKKSLNASAQGATGFNEDRCALQRGEQDA